MKYYLAYGSNLNIRQMQMRCPGAKPVGTMVLEDYELLFKGDRRYPVILGSTSSDKGRYKENMIQIVRRTLF